MYHYHIMYPTQPKIHNTQKVTIFLSDFIEIHSLAEYGAILMPIHFKHLFLILNNFIIRFYCRYIGITSRWLESN